jgi:hypothetical protein
MKVNKWTIAGFSLVAVLLALKFIAPTQPTQMTEELQTALTETALASLKAEYNLLITGKSEGIELVPRHDGMTQQYYTGFELVASALRVREENVKSGSRYTSVEVALHPRGLERRAGEFILHAVEETSEYFVFNNPSFTSQPSVTKSRTEHDFIFAAEQLSDVHGETQFGIRVGAFEYVLIEDITAPQLVSYRSNLERSYRPR